MSQLEAFATFRKPLVQVANIVSLTNTVTGVQFNFSPGSRNGTTANTSTTITAINTYDLAVGMGVSGAGVPTGATIVSIVQGTSGSITISSACTASATVTISFSSVGGNQVARIRISNVSANPCTMTIGGPTGTAAAAVPPVNASAGGATYAQTTMACGTAAAVVAGDGIRIQGNSTLEINVTIDSTLWFIAQAASAASLNIVAILQNG